MNRARGIAGLQGLAQLLLDQQLSRLRLAADRREHSRSQIAALNQPGQPADLPPVAAGQVELRYQTWADARRSELNALLARQTVEWMAARDDARQAFGRAEALRGLVDRLASGK